jgi:hypothetical protein
MHLKSLSVQCEASLWDGEGFREGFLLMLKIS